MFSEGKLDRIETVGLQGIYSGGHYVLPAPEFARTWLLGPDNNQEELVKYSFFTPSSALMSSIGDWFKSVFGQCKIYV